MITKIDLKAEFGKLTMLQGRTPEMTAADRQGSFGTLASYRDGGLFAAKFAGEGAWERHPKGDELVQILDGETKFHIITEDGPQTYELTAGTVVIVPQGAWHRFESPGGVTLMTATPQPTEHMKVTIDDPRTIEQREGDTSVTEDLRKLAPAGR
jgi:quercetin dioxygenase-like cupin family protein